MAEQPDDRLEGELRQLADRLDPVPAELLRAAAGAFAWRDIDAELAELVFDSLLDSDEVTLVRGSQERRMVTFTGGGVTIDVEVTAVGRDRTVMGQIEPPRPATVDIRRRQGTVTVEADELGRFQAGPLPAGPVSLRLRPAADRAGPAIVTDWLAL